MVRDRSGPRPGMSLFALVWPHKNWPGQGLNFKFIYHIFRRIRQPLKCNNPPLKIGVFLFYEYKNLILIFT